MVTDSCVIVDLLSTSNYRKERCEIMRSNGSVCLNNAVCAQNNNEFHNNTNNNFNSKCTLRVIALCQSISTTTASVPEGEGVGGVAICL